MKMKMKMKMKEKRYAPILFFFFLISSCSAVSAAAALDQSQALRSIADGLPSSSAGRTWNTTDPNPCLWPGVTCSPHPHVTHLSLSGLSLAAADDSSAAFFRRLCRLTSLRSLNLSLNRFAGPLPKKDILSCFPALETLDLSYNLFHGPAQLGLGDLPQLKTLNLSSNLLTGLIIIPPTPFPNLTLLDLSQNSLSGSIPESIADLPNLQSLLLSSNNLTGELPVNISTIKTLSRFAANQNRFEGRIPSGITTHLHFLDLSYNRLDGQIPSDLLSPPNLESVDLTSNSLEGRIPRNLSTRLYRLRLGGNSLTGGIPPAIGELSKLTYLELDGNRLDQKIPSQLGRCMDLALLNLASNRLQGELPKNLGDLKQLVVMKLETNNLSGEIPEEIFKLGNLSTLNLSRNSLAGQIPSSVSLLQKLSVLNLEYNELSGSLPNTISSLGSLIELQLGHNKLSGIVPRMPKSLGTALNLSHNHFSGQIPSYLSDLYELEILDLSNNNFTGEVPKSLTQMDSLTHLVLSDNQLSGILPQFHPWVNVITTGNDALQQTTRVPALPSDKRKGSTVLLIVVVMVSAFVALGLVSVILLVVLSRRFYRVEDEGLRTEEGSPRIINGRFLTKSSINSSGIDFTKAMEAVSNPNNITLKTRFSTYYKAVVPSGSSYTVKRLNWSDKIFLTGNHGKFEQELEVLGRISSSNVMVPLAYALMKDSAYLFYEDVHKGTIFDFLHKGSDDVLDWPSRYCIALGVAQGLAFLHGCSQPVLLLDLTTRSIHLKSLKEPQIGDIELCRVIDPSKSIGSLSTVAGSVGYIPPEYAYTMRVTTAGNVYSFGVILLELLTGQPPVSDGIELAKRALSYSARVNQREQILDPRIRNSSAGVHSQMLMTLKIALDCVSLSPGARPKMRNVLRMLFNAR